MPTSKPSRLAYIMDALEITGRELAAALHIDYSLVSRWKNNRRPLSPRSDHLARIADYIITVDDTAGRGLVPEILKEYAGENRLQKTENPTVLLCRWLTETKPPAPGFSIGLPRKAAASTYETTCQVYQGDKGRRSAVLAFLDTVLSMPDGQQLLLVSQEDMSWLIADLDFLNLWKEKLIQVVNRNNKIRIIHWVDRRIDSLSSIIAQWLPLYMSGNIESWFYPKYADTSFPTTLFILANKMVVTGMGRADSVKDRYTAAFRDYFTIRHSEWIFQSLLSECHPLVEKRRISSLPPQLTTLSDMENKQHWHSYLFSRMPLFLTMNGQLLTEILVYNNLDSNSIKQCLNYYNTLKSLFPAGSSTGFNRQILVHDFLAYACTSDTMVNQELSALSGQKILVSRHHFKKHINLLLEQIKDRTLEAALIPQGIASKQPFTSVSHSNLWVSENSFVFAWPNQNLTFTTTAFEATVVSGFYQLCENLWQSIPRINREQDWVISNLVRLLA